LSTVVTDLDSKYGMSFSCNHFLELAWFMLWQPALAEQGRNIEGVLGMKPRCPPEKEPICLKMVI
jgi:hypothetical protein